LRCSNLYRDIGKDSVSVHIDATSDRDSVIHCEVHPNNDVEKAIEKFGFKLHDVMI
jgi:sporulation-control protein spo0M